MGESVDPETLFKTLPAERHGEILDQALQVTANVSTVKAPNIAHLILLTSVGYNKNETKLKKCAQPNKVIIMYYLHRVQNKNIFLISSNFDLKCTTPLF